MRIIAGRWRSRRIEAPVGLATRPTADRTRETLFSMLLSRIGSFDELAVLDLFAGSGAMAFEALSRGAASACLVERNPEARRFIEASAKTLGANARLIGSDACRLPPAPAPVDLVFLDPPYGENLAAPALRSLAEQGWLAPHTWISLETARGELLDAPGFTVQATRNAGKTELRLLQPGA